MTVLSTLLGGNRQWSDMPCGVFLPYGGTSAPTGFLMCDGAAVSRTAYPDLFAVMGTVFGAGDGSTTFNVPDLRGRGVIGAGTGAGGGASGTGAPTGGSALTARANGAWLGEETHVLTVAELATHYHLSFNQGAGSIQSGGAVGTPGNSGSAGSNTPHNTMQPVVVSNWIVKAVRAFSGSQSFLSRGFIDGLITSNAADTDHDITIAAGACRDSSDAYNIVLASAFTKQIDAAWAAGSAAGGLFSGSVTTATWYHVFLIRKDIDGSIDAGFDTSVTAANKPAGYSTYRRIGSVLTNASANIWAFYQYGDKFLWKVPVIDVNGASIGTDAVTPTLTTPLGINTIPLISYLGLYKAATLPNAYLSSPDQTDGAVANSYLTHANMVAGQNIIPMGTGYIVVTNTSSQVRVRSNTAGCTYYLYTAGWIDPRGKDA